MTSNSEEQKKYNSIAPKKIILSSGLEGLLVPLKETQAVMVLILIQAGSEYETKEQNGISHLLEHMCFKGTKNLPTSKDIGLLMDGMGADFNAFTSQEHVGYYIEINHEHLKEAIDVIADVYQNPLLNEKEIEKEKNVVIEEMNMDEDRPTSQVYDSFVNLLYGDQPAGWKISGEKETVKKITRNDLVSFMENNYTANKTIIIVSGKIDEEKTRLLLERAFSGINKKNGLVKTKTTEKQTRPRVFIKNKKTEQAHLILGARAFSKLDKKRYTLSVLSAILGGGMSSRLFLKIREELGAAYYVQSIADLSSDHGFFGAAVGVALQKIDEVIGVIYDELKRLVTEIIDEKELKKAKDYIKGRMILGLESSDEYAFFYGLQYIYYKQTFSLNDIFSEIDAVDASKIQQLAKEIFQPKNLNLAILGPFKKKDEKRFKEILSKD